MDDFELLTRASRTPWWAAFAGIAAILFAAHPAHVEVVQWVAALSDPLAALFSLLSFDAWMVYRSGAPGRWRLGMSLGCFGLALLCKESAVMLPALLLLA